MSRSPPCWRSFRFYHILQNLVNVKHLTGALSVSWCCSGFLSILKIACVSFSIYFLPILYYVKNLLSFKSLWIPKNLNFLPNVFSYLQINLTFYAFFTCFSFSCCAILKGQERPTRCQKFDTQQVCLADKRESISGLSNLASHTRRRTKFNQFRIW